jgi:type IV secretory pathway TrbF-like protein
MAENIYSKGTRVWFSDKEQGWISAEVTSVIRGADDSFKLGFVDERGKVRGNALAALKMKHITSFFTGNHHRYHRKEHQRWKGGLTSAKKSASPRDRR